jgi:hypothetical protein
MRLLVSYKLDVSTVLHLLFGFNVYLDSLRKIKVITIATEGCSKQTTTYLTDKLRDEGPNRTMRYDHSKRNDELYPMELVEGVVKPSLLM